MPCTEAGGDAETVAGYGDVTPVVDLTLEQVRAPFELAARCRSAAASHALTMTRPVEAEELARMAQSVVSEKYRAYEHLAGLDGGTFHPPADAI
ncbi:MAG TPA: hypothetical protein VMD98_08420, partial [Bryocella sp.]|nr:hypothetical protein [Bryocella sp.]